MTIAERAERWLVVILAAIAAARCLIAVTPTVWFDGDPAFDGTPFAGIGPMGSVSLDGFAFLASAALLALVGRRGGGGLLLPAGVLALALAGSALLWHGQGNFESLWRGTGWLAAAVTGLSLAAALRGDGNGADGSRAIVLSILIGVVAALAVRGAWQVVFEHARTVAYFEEHGDEFLAARGWTPDSPEALSYIRRLSQREASGWFGLSNVFGAVLAVGAVTCAALLRGRLLASLRDAGSWVIGIACLAALLLVVNGGKGALAAVAAGIALAAAQPWLRSPAVRCWLVRLAVVMLPLLIAAIVMLRFGMGPDAAGGERSLFMRGYYLDALPALLRESPLGVGASGFQQAFLRIAAEACPEDAASVHHAWGDWLAAGGLAGAGLLVASVMLSWLGSARGREPAPLPDLGQALPEAAFTGAIAAAALSLLAAATAAEPEGLAVQVAAIAAFAFAARGIAAWLQRRGGADGEWRMPAVAALLIVSSLDMAQWHTGSAGWMWAMLGVAAAGAPSPKRTTARMAAAAARVGGFAGAALSLAAAGMALGRVPGLMHQESVLAESAGMIAQAAASSGSGAAGSLPLTRLRVSTYVHDAFLGAPSRHRLREIAIEQGLLGLSGVDMDDVADDALLRVHQMALDARSDSWRSVREARLLAETSMRMVARAGTDPKGPVEAWEEVVAMVPRDASAWVRLGDARARAGDDAGAREAWMEALRRDDLQVLDQTRRLPGRVRRHAESKLFSGVMLP